MKSIKNLLVKAALCGAVFTFATPARAITAETPMNYLFLSNALYEGYAKEATYYFLESKFGTVTFVDTEGKRFFIQDLVGALEIDCSQLTGDIPVVEGDKFKKFYVYHTDGTLYLRDDLYDAADIAAASPKSPIECKLSDIQFDAQSYWNKLVTVEDLTFADAGDAFSTSATVTTDANGKSIAVKPFAGTDLIGAVIPATSTVTGILNAKDGHTLCPRSMADVENAGAQPEESALEITQKLDFTGVAAPINVDTRFATFTVTARGLDRPVDIWVGGAGRAMFSASREQIPAGSGTYEVVVTYRPTAIGRHAASINFDAVPTELSSMYSLSAKAYDPANPPVINVTPSSETFEASPGVAVTKTIVVSSANMFDYGSVIVESQSVPGTFTINTSSFMYNMSANVNVTFRPLEAGDYTAVLKVAAPMAETRYVYLSGTCKGSSTAQPTEGGALVLDTSAPLTLLNEHFDNVGHNQALELSGWSNVAVKGTRAWWGYEFKNEEPVNKSAKVTAYDSKLDTDEPCEMLLVTPALDFKNAATQIFTCRIMGSYLPSEGAATPIEVLYIEDEEYMEVLDGMNIPVTADGGDKWVDYVIDFEGLDLADVFFIGFRLKSERGRNNATVYYVDDVSWGRTDVPQIKASAPWVELEGYVNQSTASGAITVEGRNLSADITLKVTGANASKFATSVDTLPAEGGTFSVIFTPEEAGVHEAYVELSSAGAPTVLIPVAALGRDVSGIDALTEAEAPAAVYNLQGIRIHDAAAEADIRALPAGLYIIDGKKQMVK